MNFDMKVKATRALINENRFEPPGGRVYYPEAFVIGDKVFLEYLAANDWRRQTRGTSQIEPLTYRDAWNFAKANHNHFKLLFLQQWNNQEK